MPVIHREHGLEFVLYTRDHPPPHLHVFDAEGECVIEIGDASRAPEIREVHNMRNRAVVRIVRSVEEHQEVWLQRWREIHGG